MSGQHGRRKPRPGDKALRPGVHAPAGFGGVVWAAEPAPLTVHPVTLLRCHQVTAHAQNVAMLEQVAPWVIAGPVNP